MIGVPPADRVREFFARDRPIGLDTNFFEAGLTSEDLVHVLDELRREGVELTLVDLYRFPTGRALMAHLSRESEPAGLPWTTRVEP